MGIGALKVKMNKYCLTLNPATNSRMDRNTTLPLKYIFSKPRAVSIAAVLLFIPLLFIGIHTSHDWGDDFAQYIHQAGNIVHGIPQSETGYVFNQYNAVIGPKAYPAGFPLLLAPVYALSGNNMLAFTSFISLIYIMLGLLMVIFYRNYFSRITALVLAIIFLYNPQMIIFKREVMSDIPFTALLVLNFILYLKYKFTNLKYSIALALITGFMLAVRPAGIVFVAAVAMEQLVWLIRRKTAFRNVALQTGMIVLIPVVLYFVINSILFRIPSGGSISDYLTFYSTGNYLQTIPENLAHYIEVFWYLYIPDGGVLRGLSLLLGAVMLAMTLIGFLKRLLHEPGVTEWFFIFYMILLLLYPYNNSAFRFMVPLGFIFLFYAATGLKTIQLFPRIPAWKKAVGIGVLIMLLFMPGLIDIARSGGEPLEGPQQQTAIATFNYISKNVPADAVVVFAKPRALALYAGCQSMADPCTADPTLVHKQVTEARASYLLMNNKLTSETMQRYARVMGSRLTKQFKNEDFTLYKINPVSP